jgi:hypothetical protein
MNLCFDLKFWSVYGAYLIDVLFCVWCRHLCSIYSRGIFSLVLITFGQALYVRGMCRHSVISTDHFCKALYVILTIKASTYSSHTHT